MRLVGHAEVPRGINGKIRLVRNLADPVFPIDALEGAGVVAALLGDLEGFVDVGWKFRPHILVVDGLLMDVPILLFFRVRDALPVVELVEILGEARRNGDLVG